ncbi:MAG TPA: thiamine pyrophosphate-dependent enzyme, partial [Thermoanaerobaculia bacterium]|nr:thiamine pyrophosphate-dependent enzyme [Thermoanaerobaculia bacterium]
MSEPTGGIRRSQFSRESILDDYRLGHLSRQASYLGRREVLTGKAKFGIFGDGKEVAQLAMARAFRPGDWRSGYYRDQTFMLAVGALTLEQYFAQLYADPDPEREPCSAGRQMNAHFATRLLDAGGEWLDLTGLPNSSSDISPTAAQMPRLVGLGYASRIFRCRPDLGHLTHLSRGGDEIAFGTIGDASCAEGLFWEAINAAAVVQAPVLLSIWDNGYGISVPIEYQLAKGSLTEVLAGFQRDKGGTNGIDLYRARGWDYPALCETYLQAADGVRREHVPAIVHVPELTQPQGHSTSGSHERYKSKERLAWEKEYDCLVQMRAWLLAQELAGDEELRRIEEEAKEAARAAQRRAWEAFQEPLREERRRFAALARGLAATSPARERISAAVDVVERHDPVQRRQLLATAAELLVATRGESAPARDALAAWYDEQAVAGRALYSTHLHSTSSRSPLAVSAVAPVYASPPETVNGYEVLNACFDAAMARVPEFLAFGEDVGALGDVNQGFMGLQEKYGLCRVTDTGI